MDIRTYFYPPPIPIRRFDWSAIDWNSYDYDQPIGYGITEKEAIADFLIQLEEKSNGQNHYVSRA